jgi:hypothetical protein
VAQRERSIFGPEVAGASASYSTHSCTTAFPRRNQLLRRRRDKAELLQHRHPIKHQIERDVLAIAKAQYLDIVQLDRATGRWNVSHGTVEDAALRPHEGAFFNRDIIDNVNGLTSTRASGKATNQLPKLLGRVGIPDDAGPHRSLNHHPRKFCARA